MKRKAVPRGSRRRATQIIGLATLGLTVPGGTDFSRRSPKQERSRKSKVNIHLMEHSSKTQPLCGFKRSLETTMPSVVFLESAGTTHQVKANLEALIAIRKISKMKSKFRLFILD